MVVEDFMAAWDDFSWAKFTIITFSPSGVFPTCYIYPLTSAVSEGTLIQPRRSRCCCPSSHQTTLPCAFLVTARRLQLINKRLPPCLTKNLTHERP
ncbi:uncharacterized protein J3R85_019304 [Psidium guajava]|nr:uncharacterized protein J3R85_019304 [Psidium guajava]